MSKNIPILSTDLEANGYADNGAGVFTFVGRGKVAKQPEILTSIPKERPQGLVSIENVLRASRIEFEREYQFHPERKWKFDLVVNSLKIAIEYEGIFSEKSRHTGVKGYTEDANKYNAAQLLGWKVLRYTAMNYKHFIDDLKTILQ